MGSGHSTTKSARETRQRGNGTDAIREAHGAASGGGQVRTSEMLTIPLVEVQEQCWNAVAVGSRVSVHDIRKGRLEVLAGPELLGMVPPGYVEVVLERSLFAGRVKTKGRRPAETTVQLRSSR